MQRKLLIKTTIYCTIFFLAAMAGMLYYDATKIIVIADAVQDSNESSDTQSQKMDTQYRLVLGKTRGNTNAFIIPLEEGIKAENVVIENHYMDKQLWIGIKGATAKYYETSAVTGNLKQIVDGGFDYENDTVWIKLKMQSIYEVQSTLEKNALTISYEKPCDIYDKIIVIDAGHGGEDAGGYAESNREKRITLSITSLLKEQLDQTNIRVYYTRTIDENITSEQRASLANELEADMMISIHTNENEDSSVSGIETVCNSKYFIQDFNSVVLSELLEKNVVSMTGAKAAGIAEAGEEDTVITMATIPAAIVRVGYLTNREEEGKLEEDEYQKKIADGIYQTIMDAYEEIQ